MSAPMTSSGSSCHSSDTQYPTSSPLASVTLT